MTGSQTNSPSDQPLIAERYRLLAELGQGGVGTVYRAHDTLLERDVAVKLLGKGGSALNTEARERLLNEARLAAQLNHPHIVSIYDAGETEGQPFIIMELVEGQALQDHPVGSQAELLAIVQQVCAALEHAHSHGIIHRDLKPGNVLITSDGTAKLTDFGLAHSVASRITVEGQIVGTVFYIAPEQAMGQPVDERTDLYALGVMLYELSAGRLPFTAEEPLAVISQHLYAPVVPPSTYRPDLPHSLDKLILKLLAKDPRDRCASAAEVSQALRSILATGQAEIAPAGEEIEAADAFLLLEKLARGRLVGRRGEVDQLRELWKHVKAGHSLLVLVSGEPGVGKTRLAHEMLVYAQLSGAVVLKGGCYEYEAATPYLPLVEALREWVRTQTPESLRQELAAFAPELSRLAPEIESKLGPLPHNPTLPASEERLRLFDQTARFIEKLAGQKGLLLFIDDMHWADQGTLALLHYLVRNLRSTPMMVLAAYREVELDRSHPFAAALVEWNRERLAMRLQLARLSESEVGELLASFFGVANVSQEFIASVFRETEGNPFFIEEVIKSLIEQGEIYRVDGRWERQEIDSLAIPQSIKEAIGRRLNRLSAACIDTLHLAAVLGKRFNFQELAASSEVNEDDLLDTLDEAASAQLVRVEVEESFVFTHDKIREVLYEEINPVRRRRLHKRIGEGLENLYGSEESSASLMEHVQDMAHHFVESGDLPKGLKYSLLAGHKSSRIYAYEEAVHYYQHALECAKTLDLAEQQAEIYKAIGQVYFQRSLVESAIENFQHALELTGDPYRRAELKVWIGEVCANVGDDCGGSFLHEALQELDPKTQTSQLARATAAIGRLSHMHAEFEEAIDYLEQARQLAEPLDDGYALQMIYAYLAGAYQNLISIPDSLAWAQRCVELGERKNMPHASAVGLEYMAEDSVITGKWRAAIEYGQRDYDIGARIGALGRMGWGLASISNAYYGLGNLAAALENADEALALGERQGDLRLCAYLRSNRALIHVAAGNIEAAQEDVAFCLARAEETGMNQAYGWASNAAGILYYYVQDWKKCAEIIEEIEKRRGGRREDLRVQVLMGQGRFDEIRQRYANWRITDGGSDHQKASSWRLDGRVYSVLGDHRLALELLNRAITIFEQHESQLELAWTYFRRAEAYQEGGDSTAAHQDAQRALELFTQCGAKLFAEQAQALLDGLPAA